MERRSKRKNKSKKRVKQELNKRNAEREELKNEITLADLLTRGILTYEGLEAAKTVEEAMNKVMKDYVLERHKQTITHIENGKKKGFYKTYVGNPRREVCRKTYNALIEELFKLYSGVGVISTIEGAIEWELEHRRIDLGSQEDTIDTLRYCVRRVLSEEMLKTNVADVTERMVCKRLRKRIKEKHLTYSDVKTTLQVLHGAFRQSIGRHLITADPLVTVKAKACEADCEDNRRPEKSAESIKTDCEDNKRPEKPATSADESEVVSQDVIGAILRHFEARTQDVSARALILSILTGLRIGEIPALMCEDIGEEFLHVHRQQKKIKRTDTTPQSFVMLNYTKNERCKKREDRKGRYIPLDLQEAIRPHLELCLRFSSGNYLFENKAGEPINKDQLRTYLVRHMGMIEKELKIRLPKKKNHLFRKSLNTNILIPMGLDELERSMILGHSVRVNLENYTYQGSYKYDGILKKVKKNREFTHIHSFSKPNPTDKVIPFPA